MADRVARKASALRLSQYGSCIVAVCENQREAEEINSAFLKVSHGCLQWYTQISDLMKNLPTRRVVSLILATGDSPAAMGQTLRWMRYRWPRCLITVVGDVGCSSHEMAARQNGASYLIRPVTAEEWTAVILQATGQKLTFGRRERPLKGLPLHEGGGW